MRRKISKAVRNRFLSLLRPGVPIARAADRIGISHATGYRWAKDARRIAASSKPAVGVKRAENAQPEASLEFLNASFIGGTNGTVKLEAEQVCQLIRQELKKLLAGL